MYPQPNPTPSRPNRRCRPLAARLALLAGLLFATHTACAQPTLMFRFPMDAAHSSATGTTNDGGGALPAGIVLQTLLSQTAATTTNFLQTNGVGPFPAGFSSVDLRGGPNSGVQGVGESLNFTNNVNPGVVPALMAVAELNPALASMGDGVTPGSTFSSFVSTIWINVTVPALGVNDTAGPVLWMMGVNGANAPGTANTITFRYNSRQGTTFNGITNTFLARIGNAASVEAPIYFPNPSQLWLFFAVVYDANLQNAYIYYGTEGSPAKLMGIKKIGAQTFTFNSGTGGATATLSVGNIVNTWSRHFDGKIADLRFWTGVPGGDVANQAFVEGIRQERTPLLITGLYPDGTTLMEGTNTLAFTASSANGINPANIHVAVNGADVSGSLVIGGPSTARTVSYTGLPVNQTLTGYPGFVPNLNLATITMSLTDSNGISTTNAIAYDDYAPTNFTVEAEDYDFNSGQHIDNPAYSFTSVTNGYFGLAGAGGIDYVNVNPVASFYRGSDPVGTELSVSSTADNGNQNNGNEGELMRAKVLAALDLNADGLEDIREVDVNNFAAGDSMNYTRTYPGGYFYIYLRAAGFTTAKAATLSKVTGGWGTGSQATSVLGTFSFTNSGGTEDYGWIPLNNNGTNAIIPLSGTNTLNLAAGMTGSASGGPNVNFFMLVQQPVPGFTLQPVNQTTASGFTASFTSKVFATNSITYQWQRSNPGVTSFVSISGATSAGYTTPVLTVGADNQAQYQVLATAGGITITSAVAVVTVSAPVPPVLLGAGDDFTGITVLFDQAVDPVTGANPLNYTLNGGASVTAAVVSGSTVLLTPGGLTLGQTFTLTVNNVQNLYGNVVAANSAKSFGAYTLVDNFNGGVFPVLPTYANIYGVTIPLSTGGTTNTGRLQLVAAAQNQAGSIVFPDALNGGDLGSFEAAFNLQLANPSVPPADNFSFNLGSDVAEGTFGGGTGTGLSLVIALNAADTRANTAPPCISVIYQGAVAQSALDASFLTQSIDPAILTDGLFHQVIFKVAADGTLTLVINGVTYFGGQVIAGWGPLTAPKLAIGGNCGNSYTQMSIDDLQVVYNGTLPLPLPPTVRITSPFNLGTYPAGADVPVTVDAADPQGNLTKVEYFVNGTKVFTNTVAPYSFTLTNVGNSVYNIAAKVTDALNLTSTSPTVQIIAGNPPQMLYVTGAGGLNASDAAFISHLNNLGFNVIQEADANATTGDALGKVLVITSSTVNSANVGATFQVVAVPVLNWEQALYGVDLFTLDDAADHNVDASAQSQIRIINPASPLAAGLSGTVTVQTAATSMPWGIPSTNAILVALVPGSTNEYCLFAYEKGALLIDGVTPAPARRVQTFLFDNDYATLNANGLKLMDAAVAWLLATPQPVIHAGTVSGNSLTLTWTVGGTLQAAPAPNGPWLDVSTTNSFTTTITNNTARFFRVKL